jgi:predicted transcriptional regulator of viral defense system
MDLTLNEPHLICERMHISYLFAYNTGMAALAHYLDSQLVRGRAYFTREEALAELSLSPLALKASITRLVKKQRLANLRHGFYLILRPEDRVAGAPDPARWIDPLMKYQGIDYRISLLRAAAFHGSSHQAAMTFQVIVPKQLRGFEIGRHRLQFIYQAPAAFAQVNQVALLGSIKSETGFAKVAGIELTLLDCARYFHKSAGIGGLAQIVKDLGAQANARKLAKAAEAYENASVRRLGYLLDRAGHELQATALEPFVKKAKTSLLLNPSVKPLLSSLAGTAPRASKWKLVINESVEADS